MKEMELEWAQRQLQGRRKEQQDRCAELKLDGDLLVVVADGMGGHVGGAVASEQAIDGFLHSFSSRADEAADAHPTDALDAALQRANLRIGDRVAEQPRLRGMGTTLVGVLFRSRRMFWVSVGDSLLYRLRDGDLARLNVDHSFGAELDRRAALGEISIEQARRNPRRHIVTSAVMGTWIALVDRPRDGLVCQSGDRFLLASDGILTLESDAIAAQLGQADSASAAVEALSDAVLAADEPMQDNCTLVAVFVR